MMSTPAPHVGRATLRASAALARGADVRSADEAARRMGAVFTVIGSPGYPLERDFLAELGRRSYERGVADPMATRRQLAAMRASGDRRRALAGLRVPTLVLHGDADPLVRPAGGRATAAAIPGAKLVTYPGMGHDLPRPLWPRFQSEIAALAGA
jgi:pimeloyl-ACP methyl ester carboxylesterase